jgi:peptidoglycan-associated lipoprotein
MSHAAMSKSTRPRHYSVIAGALALAFASAGCAHVGEDEFQAEVQQLRAEIQDGDEAVETRLGSRIDALDQRMDALEGELQSLSEEFDLEIERLEASLRVHTPIHFGFDRADLTSQDIQLLERVSAVLREHYPRAMITVEGFTDPAGSAAYNERLGMRRAESVMGWLVETGGLAAPQVRAVSYGESTERQIRPGEAGPGERGRENRRVVIVIDHSADANVIT